MLPAFGSCRSAACAWAAVAGAAAAATAGVWGSASCASANVVTLVERAATASSRVNQLWVFMIGCSISESVARLALELVVIELRVGLRLLQLPFLGRLVAGLHREVVRHLHAADVLVIGDEHRDVDHLGRRGRPGGLALG